MNITTKDQLQEIDPTEFEHFVASLWEESGWSTTVTQQSQDAGVDILATRSDPVSQRVVIQVKRYQNNNRVSSAEVQQYAALKKQESADSVVIVTSGSFTEPAQNRGRELDIQLVDGDDLIEIIEEGELLATISRNSSKSQGEVQPPQELAANTISQLQSTKGTVYLAAIAASIAALYANLLTGLEIPLWIGWVAVPLTAYVHAKAVPQAIISKRLFVLLPLFPLLAGPYYLITELQKSM